VITQHGVRVGRRLLYPTSSHARLKQHRGLGSHLRAFRQRQVNPHSMVTNNFRFPGQYYDSETGYHYNYHRYYDPKTGRYLTPDPIGLAGGINPYVYVLNDPVNAIDPEGLWIAQVIGAGIGAGVNAYKNWDAWQSGTISTGQFWASVGVGAATGLLSSLGGGIISGALLGGSSAFINNVGNQYITNDPCEGIDWRKAFIAGGLGYGSGFISGLGTAAGLNIIRIPDPLCIGGRLGNYGTVGGIVGNVTGTILTY
jgi:RHS repeat-associated protein